MRFNQKIFFGSALSLEFALAFPRRVKALIPLKVDQSVNVIFFSKTRDHSLFVKVEPTLKVQRRSRVKDIPPIVGQHVDEGFLRLHSKAISRLISNRKDLRVAFQNRSSFLDTLRSFGYASG